MNSVAIVGCGPAGLSTAIALHDAGFHVHLYEQFDKPGPVGSGLMLQPTGLAVLESWGLRNEVEALGQRIDGMLGRMAPDGKVVLDIAYDSIAKNSAPPVYGVAIHRASLFHVLFNAVKARAIPVTTGVRIQTKGADAMLEHDSDATAQLYDQNNTLISNTHDFIVDASGTQSSLAKQLPFGALWTTVQFNSAHFNSLLLEQRYQRASVMVGVLPCGRLPGSTTQLATLFWSIKADEYQAFLANGLSHWKNEVCKIWPAVECLLDDINSVDDLTFATYSHYTLKKPYAPGMVYVGDAAHATSPQLGQGVNMAMLDAYALAKAMNYTLNNTLNKDGNSNVSNQKQFDEAAVLYARMRARHVKLFQAASLTLTPFYQSNSKVLPAIRDWLFEPVSALPFAKTMVTALGAGVLTQPIKRIDRLSQ